MSPVARRTPHQRVEYLQSLMSYNEPGLDHGVRSQKNRKLLQDTQSERFLGAHIQGLDHGRIGEGIEQALEEPPDEIVSDEAAPAAESQQPPKGLGPEPGRDRI